MQNVIIYNLMKIQDEKHFLLERIANHLIINSSFLDDLGLFHGKMGVVIFFYHYSRYTNNPIYEEFAGELLDEIYEEIHLDMSIGLESGLSGIGWGVNYLFQNNFVNGDLDNVLKDINQKIAEYNFEYITDYSLRTGLKGILCYINQCHILSLQKSNKSFFDRICLSKYRKLIYDIDVKYRNELLILSLLSANKKKGANIMLWPLGLEGGCAGESLKIILL